MQLPASAAAPERPVIPPVGPPPPPVPPAHPLLAALDEHLRRTDAARGRSIRLGTLPLGGGALATLRPDGSVELAATHPLAAAIATHPEALGIFAAHVLGLGVRDNDDAREAESHAILALLTRAR